MPESWPLAVAILVIGSCASLACALLAIRDVVWGDEDVLELEDERRVDP